MDENPQQDSGEEQNPAGNEPTREFDPEEVESDPAQNPPVEELKDLKGG